MMETLLSGQIKGFMKGVIAYNFEKLTAENDHQVISDALKTLV